MTTVAAPAAESIFDLPDEPNPLEVMPQTQAAPADTAFSHLDVPAPAFTSPPPAFTAPRPAFATAPPNIPRGPSSAPEPTPAENSKRYKKAGIIVALASAALVVVGLVLGLLWVAFQFVSFPQPVVALKGHEAGVFAVSSPQAGSVLASASRDGTVKIWDAQTGQVTQSIDLTPTCIAMSPDGKKLYAAKRQTIQVFDTSSGEVVDELLLEFEKGRSTWPIECLTVSADGQRLAAGCDHWLNSFGEGRGIAVWDLSDPANKVPLCTSNRSAGCLVISPNGRYLAAGFGRAEGRDGASSGSLALFHTDSLDPVKGFEARCSDTSKLAHEGGRTSSVAFSPDGQLLVSASADTVALVAGVRGLASNRGNAAAWRVPSGQLVGTMKPDLKHCNAVFFSKDGTSIVVAGGNPYPTMRSGGIYVFDANTFQQQTQLVSQSYTVESAARLCEDGRYVWAASTDSLGREAPDKLKMQFKIASY